MWGFHITSITLKGLRAGDVFNSAVLDFSQTMVYRQLHLSDRRGRILKPSQVIIFYITSILFYYYMDFWSRIKSPWCVGSPLESVLYLTRQNSGSLDPGQILSLFCAFPPHCLFFFGLADSQGLSFLTIWMVSEACPGAFGELRDWEIHSLFPTDSALPRAGLRFLVPFRRTRSAPDAP